MATRRRNPAATRLTPLLLLMLQHAEVGVPGKAEGLKVICIREEAPPVRSHEQLVARPGVSNHLPIRVDRVPVNRREDGVVAELANVERDPVPGLNVRRFAISADGRGEVIPYGAVVRHVDRLAPPNCKERAETEVGDTFNVSRDVAASVLIEQRLDRPGHQGTVAPVAAWVKPAFLDIQTDHCRVVRSECRTGRSQRSFARRGRGTGSRMSVEDLNPGSPLVGGTPLHRFRCVGCSYGASRSAAPERCPMCGGSTWEYEAWRPFSNLASDLAPKQGSPGWVRCVAAADEEG